MTKRDIRWWLRGPVHVAKRNEDRDTGLIVRTFYWCWPMSRFTRLAELWTFHKWDSIVHGTTTGFELIVGKWRFELQRQGDDA